jgi:hypothetical protein
MKEVSAETLPWRVRLFEFLAAPAYIWFWVAALICGLTFERCPACEEDDDDGTRR